MGGIAALLNFDRAPAASSEIEQIASRMGDGTSPTRNLVEVSEHLAVAILPRGMEDDSLSVASSPRAHARRRWAALDGWIDNRADLWKQLGLTPPRVLGGSDAELILVGFEAYGEEFFERLVGPYAILLLDSHESCAFLARDPLGTKSLFFRKSARSVVFASRPWPLARNGPAPLELNETTIARFLAIRGPLPGETFFRGVEEAPAGDILRITAAGSRLLRSIHLRPAPRPGRGTEDDYEERFRELLDQAVSRRLPRRGGTAIAMSGGLDSTAVAASAAKILEAQGSEPPVTISWVFPHLNEADEKGWIDAATKAIGSRQRLVNGDDLGPTAGDPTWPQPLDSPFQDLYWGLRRRTLSEARASGCSVLLNGDWGDRLWFGGMDWLGSLLRHGELLGTISSIAQAIGFAARGERLRYSLRASVGLLVRGYSAQGPAGSTPWLTSRAKRLAAESTLEPLPNSVSAAALSRLRPIVSSTHVEAASALDALCSPLAVDVRRPFRDRDLVEFFLEAPAHALYRPGENKRLLRRAMADRLPAQILERQARTSLLSLADRGLEREKNGRMRDLLAHSSATWPQFVRRDWLWREALAAIGSPQDGTERLVVWYCFCLESWRRALEQRIAQPLRFG
jgi:asparagine synthase (glutamine-hydrolysing)